MNEEETKQDTPKFNKFLVDHTAEQDRDGLEKFLEVQAVESLEQDAAAASSYAGPQQKRTSLSMKQVIPLTDNEKVREELPVVKTKAPAASTYKPARSLI